MTGFTSSTEAIEQKQMSIEEMKIERYIEFLVFPASTVVTSTLRLLLLRITLAARSLLLLISRATDTAKNHLHRAMLMLLLLLLAFLRF
jgi:hypothetical protein